MRDPDKRSLWFSRGVRAWEQAFGNSVGGYVCPLCTQAFDRSALEVRILTLEHAPPEALGGREVCLTCARCNNDAGRTVDAHMHRRELALDFVRGEMKNFRPARLTVRGVSMNVDHYHGGGGVLISGVPRVNPPGAVGRLEAALDSQLVDQSLTIEPYRDTFDNRLAVVGWLRSAYLIAFAAFGYRFAFHGTLDRVREQLAHPERDVLGLFSVYLPAADRDSRSLLIVEDPCDLASLLVQFGRQLVFLPWKEAGIHDRLQQRKARHPSFDAQLSGRQVPWPEEPLHLLDYPSQ